MSLTNPSSGKLATGRGAVGSETSKAAMSGSFTAKDSFCGRDDGREHDDQQQDLTVSEALYQAPATAATEKKGGKGDEKGGCKDGREHDDAPKPPQANDDFKIPPQRIEHPMSSPSDVPPR